MAARQRARDAIGITARENRDVAASRRERAGEQYDHDVREEERLERTQSRIIDYYGDRSSEANEAMDNTTEAYLNTSASRARMREAGQMLRDAQAAYENTPLGKIENAARDAADAVNNALESVKNLTISALSNLRRR